MLPSWLLLLLRRRRLLSATLQEAKQSLPLRQAVGGGAGLGTGRGPSLARCRAKVHGTIQRGSLRLGVQRQAAQESGGIKLGGRGVVHRAPHRAATSVGQQSGGDLSRWGET